MEGGVSSEKHALKMVYNISCIGYICCEDHNINIDI
mgnify:CR=1 FL=1